MAELNKEDTEFVNAIIEGFDTNNDKKLNKEEFISLMSKTLII